MKKILIVAFLYVVLIIHLTYFSRKIDELQFIKNEIAGFLSDESQKFLMQTEIDSSFDNQKSKYDIDSIELSIEPDFKQKKVFASELITIRLRRDFSLEYLIFDCGSNIKVQSVQDSKSRNCFYFQKRNKLFIKPIENDSKIQLKIDYQFKFEDRFYKGFIYEENRKHFYTLSEPNFAKYWYICKEDPSDKFFATIKFKIPNNKLAVSNGILVDSSSLNNKIKLLTYRSKYPISHYLLFVAGGDYKVIKDTFVDHKTKSRLRFENFVFQESFERANDDLELMKVIYERYLNFIGEYPFKDEVYGIVEVSWPYGGMEHQTRSAITTDAFSGLYSFYGLLAHEFAHQWFGDFVTCKTWKDIWLNEGFAEYFEYISYNSPKSSLQLDLPNDNFYGSVYKTSGFIFSRTVYDKGAWILEMLRNELGDELFFKIIKEYLNRFAFSSATTRDFILLCNEISKKDLNWFFNQWLYSPVDKPFYKLTFNSEKRENDYFCKVKIEQIQPRTIFNTKLDLVIQFFDGTSELFTLKNDSKFQYLFFNSKSKIKSAYLDPENKVLKEVI
jgi:aminopeptidase N